MDVSSTGSPAVLSSGSGASSSSGGGIPRPPPAPWLDGFRALAREDVEQRWAPVLSFQQLQRISYDFGRSLGWARLAGGSDTLCESAAILVANSFANGLRLQEYKHFVRRNEVEEPVAQENSQGRPRFPAEDSQGWQNPLYRVTATGKKRRKGQKKKPKWRYQNRIYRTGPNAGLPVVLPRHPPPGVNPKRWEAALQCLRVETDDESRTASSSEGDEPAKLLKRVREGEPSESPEEAKRVRPSKKGAEDEFTQEEEW